jgi:hypothetical protein
MRIPLRLPDRRVENVGIDRIERDVVRARALAPEEHVLPMASAIARAEDPPLLGRAPRVAQCRDIHEIRIPRMHDDASDVSRIAQPDIGPGLAAVARPVDAVSVRDVVADAGLARSGVDDVGIGRGDREGTHSRRREKAIRDAEPGPAAVGGLPYAARARALVEGHRVGRAAGDGNHAAATMRADASPVQRRKQALLKQSDRVRQSDSPCHRR